MRSRIGQRQRRGGGGRSEVILTQVRSDLQEPGGAVFFELRNTMGGENVFSAEDHGDVFQTTAQFTEDQWAEFLAAPDDSEYPVTITQLRQREEGDAIMTGYSFSNPGEAVPLIRQDTMTKTELLNHMYSSRYNTEYDVAEHMPAFYTGTWTQTAEGYSMLSAYGAISEYDSTPSGRSSRADAGSWTGPTDISNADLQGP